MCILLFRLESLKASVIAEGCEEVPARFCLTLLAFLVIHSRLDDGRCMTASQLHMLETLISRWDVAVRYRHKGMHDWLLSVTVRRRAAWSCHWIPPSRTGGAADACCISTFWACHGNEGLCAMYWDNFKPAESTKNCLVGCTSRACRVGGVRGGRPRSSAAFKPRQDRDRFRTLRLSVRPRTRSTQILAEHPVQFTITTSRCVERDACFEF